MTYGDCSQILVLTADAPRYTLLMAEKSNKDRSASAWSQLDLQPGTYAFRIVVGGGNDHSSNAEVTLRTASDDADKSGTVLFSKSNKDCNGGKTFTGVFELSEPVPYLYLSFSSITNSTFDARVYLAGSY